MQLILCKKATRLFFKWTDHIASWNRLYRLQNQVSFAVAFEMRRRTDHPLVPFLELLLLQHLLRILLLIALFVLLIVLNSS